MNLSIRELTRPDIERIADYWLNATPEYLLGMGADLAKMPSRTDFTQMMSRQLVAPYKRKAAYPLIWLLDGIPIGHSHTNKIKFGEEAYMHLHLWQPDYRQKGAGTQFVQLSLPYFFENLQLETLYCEPYAHNPAPNKTLEKVGFEYVKTYTTIPGSLNFEQEVKQWRMTKAQFLSLK